MVARDKLLVTLGDVAIKQVTNFVRHVLEFICDNARVCKGVGNLFLRQALRERFASHTIFHKEERVDLIQTLGGDMASALVTNLMSAPWWPSALQLEEPTRKERPHHSCHGTSIRAQ